MSFIHIPQYPLECQPRCPHPSFSRSALGGAPQIPLGTVWACARCGREWKLVRYSNGGHFDLWQPQGCATRSAEVINEYDRRRKRKRQIRFWVIAAIFISLPVAFATWGSIWAAANPNHY